MVTAKREIKTEEERYGGYAPKLVAVKSRPASAATYYREYNASDELASQRYDEQFDSGILRGRSSGVRTAPEVRERESVVIAPPTMPKKRFAEPKRAEEDDLYPTYTTMRTIEEEGETVRPEAKTHKRVKLNARGKAIVIGYAVVIVALLAVVIMNAVAISGISASVSALTGEVTQAAQEVNEKQIDLNNVSTPAKPSDMGEATQVVEVTLPAPKEQAAYVPASNWFDRFCDFLSGIFGG